MNSDITDMGLPQATLDAGELVLALWRGMPTERKTSYAKRIWEQVESMARSSARTSPQLRLWLEHAKAMFGSQIVGTRDVATVLHIVAAGRDQEILRALRDETSTVVALVRVWEQERKAQWQQEQQEPSPPVTAA